MKSPFPGMDPYLEHPARWPGVHNSLITAIRDVLSPAVAPNYYVDVESRAYVIFPDEAAFIGRPDVSIISPVGVLPGSYTIHEEQTNVDVYDMEVAVMDVLDHYYLAIREVGTHTLVTMIELLSPVNKVDKRGREAYLDKREEVMASRTNLVEIDLLRVGNPLPLADNVPKRDYRILVCRGWQRPRGRLYAFDMPSPIPDIHIPLLRGDDMPLLSLNQLVHELYERARYDLRIDYATLPQPPLRESQQDWMHKLLRSR